MIRQHAEELQPSLPTPAAGTSPFMESQPVAFSPPFTRQMGVLRYHHGFRSSHLNNERTLVVYLPPGYDASPTLRYPVLYMHDGQNLFDPATAYHGVCWQAHETADRLILKRRVRPFIIVGVYNTPDRIFEYTAHMDTNMQGGKGHLYARFLFEEVKVFIDKEYRTRPTRPYTGVLGSSLGGLISLAMAKDWHQHFKMCGIMSPSLWWAKGALLKELQGGPRWMRRMRFWVDMGNKEGGAAKGELPSAITRTRKLIEHFDMAGLLPGHHYYYTEITGGEHNESHWAARLDKVFLYFLGRRGKLV